eukprot:352239-Chlamydomonas_euryale.AAC.3
MQILASGKASVKRVKSEDCVHVCVHEGVGALRAGRCRLLVAEGRWGQKSAAHIHMRECTCRQVTEDADGYDWLARRNAGGCPAIYAPEPRGTKV